MTDSESNILESARCTRSGFERALPDVRNVSARTVVYYVFNQGDCHAEYLSSLIITYRVLFALILNILPLSRRSDQNRGHRTWSLAKHVPKSHSSKQGVPAVHHFSHLLFSWSWAVLQTLLIISMSTTTSTTIVRNPFCTSYLLPDITRQTRNKSALSSREKTIEAKTKLRSISDEPADYSMVEGTRQTSSAPPPTDRAEHDSPISTLATARAPKRTYILLRRFNSANPKISPSGSDQDV